MPLYYRRSRYSRYRRYGYRRGYGYRRYARSGAAYTRRVLRKTATGTKSTSVVIEKDYDITLSLPANTSYTNPVYIGPSGGSFGNLAAMGLYQTYAALFDKFRVRAMYVTWNFASGILNNNGVYATFYTCLDRHGATGERETSTAQDIVNASSVVKNTFTTNQRLTAKRYTYAASFLEKNTWCDTDYQSAGNTIPDLEDQENAYNPFFLFTLWVQGQTTSPSSTPARISIKYVVDFKNPKAEASLAAKDAKTVIPFDDDDEDIVVDELSKMGSQTTSTTPVYKNNTKTRR